MFLLPIGKYAVGSTLPPHLSPWVDDEEEGYKPAYAEEIERLKNGEAAPELEDDQSAASGSDDEAVDAMEEEVNDEEEDGDEEEDDEEEEEEVKEEKAQKAKSKEEKEAHDRAKIMMSKKASRLYGRMQHGITEKTEKSEKLQQRREELSKGKKGKGLYRGMEPVVAKNIEKLEELQKKRVDIKGKGKGSAGETANKQRVGRLKKERKVVEDEYAKSEGSMKKSKKQRTK